jgi:hypothetical protein
MEAKTDMDIDGIRQMKVRVPVPDQYSEGNFNRSSVLAAARRLVNTSSDHVH